jgi:hypothetical protein
LAEITLSALLVGLYTVFTLCPVRRPARVVSAGLLAAGRLLIQIKQHLGIGFQFRVWSFWH